MARYALALLLSRPHQFWPLGTWVANACASLLLGLFMAWTQRQYNPNESVRLLVAVGFCGGFSTFSTFSAEVWQLFQQQAYGWALGYVAASFLLAIAALALGIWLGGRWLTWPDW